MRGRSASWFRTVLQTIFVEKWIHAACLHYQFPAGQRLQFIHWTSKSADGYDHFLCRQIAPPPGFFHKRIFSRNLGKNFKLTEIESAALQLNAVMPGWIGSAAADHSKSNGNISFQKITEKHFSERHFRLSNHYLVTSRIFPNVRINKAIYLLHHTVSQPWLYICRIRFYWYSHFRDFRGVCSVICGIPNNIRLQCDHQSFRLN